MADEHIIDEYARTLYEFEFESKHKLDSSDTFLLAIVTLLGGVGITCARLIQFEWPDNFQSGLFTLLTIAFGLSWFVAVVCLIASVGGGRRNVGYVAPAREIANFLDNLTVFYGYSNTERKAAESAAVDDLQQAIRNNYIEAGSVNRVSNHIKGRWQGRAKQAITIAVVLMIPNTPLMILEERARPKVQKMDLQTVPLKIEVQNEQ